MREGRNMCTRSPTLICNQAHQAGVSQLLSAAQIIVAVPSSVPFILTASSTEIGLEDLDPSCFAAFISNTSLSLPCRSFSSNENASDKFTARNVLGSLTLHSELVNMSWAQVDLDREAYWLNLARSVLMTCSQSACGVKLRLGAHPMQCRLSN